VFKKHWIDIIGNLSCTGPQTSETQNTLDLAVLKILIDFGVIKTLAELLKSLVDGFEDDVAN